MAPVHLLPIQMYTDGKGHREYSCVISTLHYVGMGNGAWLLHVCIHEGTYIVP